MKKYSKIFLVVVLLLLFALCAVACTEDTNDITAAENSLTFTDMTGREISLDAPAEHIVVLTAADCEILFALDAGDTVVGRGEYCDYPEAVADIPAVQSGSETNLEQIIDLEPDVVVMGIMDQTEEQVTALENAGVPVVVSAANDIAGVYEAIQMMGTLTGKTAEAEAFVQSMQDAFAEIESKVTEDSGENDLF